MIMQYDRRVADPETSCLNHQAMISNVELNGREVYGYLANKSLRVMSLTVIICTALSIVDQILLVSCRQASRSGTSKADSRQHSSLRQHCQIRRNSLVR